MTKDKTPYGEASLSDENLALIQATMSNDDSADAIFHEIFTSDEVEALLNAARDQGRALSHQPSGVDREAQIASVAAVIDRHKCEPWTVDRANQMAEEILALLPTAPVASGDLWSTDKASSFRDGFLAAIGREPWDDMHDWLALVSVDYVKDPKGTLGKVNDKRLSHPRPSDASVTGEGVEELREAHLALADLRGKARDLLAVCDILDEELGAGLPILDADWDPPREALRLALSPKPTGEG